MLKQSPLTSPTTDGFRDTKKFDVTMSLTRAFTKRSKRPEIPLQSPTRAASTRIGPINRKQISAPLELLSTTNVLAYNAPDIHASSPLSRNNQSSSASSTNSLDDVDSLPALSSSSSMTTPDHSDIESSPSPVEPNHLSCYFQSPGRSSSSAGSHRKSNASSDTDAPAIPQRASSHTRRSHQEMASKRSLRKSPPPQSIPTLQNMARTSLDMFSSKVEADHPFGAELEQVNELAEEYAGREVLIVDEDEQFLTANDLRKFCAEDYVMEIESLFGGVFEDSFLSMSVGWI